MQFLQQQQQRQRNRTGGHRSNLAGGKHRKIHHDLMFTHACLKNKLVTRRDVISYAIELLNDHETTIGFSSSIQAVKKLKLTRLLDEQVKDPLERYLCAVGRTISEYNEILRTPTVRNETDDCKERLELNFTDSMLKSLATYDRDVLDVTTIHDTIPMQFEYDTDANTMHQKLSTRRCDGKPAQSVVNDGTAKKAKQTRRNETRYDGTKEYRNELFKSDRDCVGKTTPTQSLGAAASMTPPPSRQQSLNGCLTPPLSYTNGSVRARCGTCGNDDANTFETDDVDNRRMCLKCSTVVKVMESGSVQHDYNRINSSSKFSDNRFVHFQDCIKQVQGKQNCKIPDKVYADIDAKFKAYRLLVEDDNDDDEEEQKSGTSSLPEIVNGSASSKSSHKNCASSSSASSRVRYSKITPQHIMLFLKELKYTKHYENVNVIYYALTNKRVTDISHLESKLIDDFREFVALYDRYHSKDKPDNLNRKNFINCQYLLFQLLRRHGYNCHIEDFSVLKTTDRKLFHDNVCSRLFEDLRWNFTKTF